MPLLPAWNERHHTAPPTAVPQRTQQGDTHASRLRAGLCAAARSTLAVCLRRYPEALIEDSCHCGTRFDEGFRLKIVTPKGSEITR